MANKKPCWQHEMKITDIVKTKAGLKKLNQERPKLKTVKGRR